MWVIAGVESVDALCWMSTPLHAIVTGGERQDNGAAHVFLGAKQVGIVTMTAVCA
jgi:hypothetical protein